MRVAVLSLLMLVSMGCWRSDSPPLSTVTGFVTLDGNPIPDAEVTFQPRDGGRGSAGVTDTDGQYQLSYRHGEPGAIVGPHVVSISTARRSDKDADEAEVPESIPTSYNEQSTLTAEVEVGSNNVDFDLRSKAKSAQPTGTFTRIGRPAEVFH